LVNEIVPTDQADARLIHNQSVALIKVGDVDVATDRAASALSNYRDALKIREQLSSTAASDVFLRRDLAEALLKTGDALALNGEKSRG
jgi:hypothetical protein